MGHPTHPHTLHTPRTPHTPHRQAIDQMAAQHDAHLKDVEARADVSNQTEALEQLKATLAEREDDLDQAQRDAQEVSKQLVSMYCVLKSTCTIFIECDYSF